MRYLKVCAGDAATAEFYQPVVESGESGRLETVVNPDSIVLRARGGSIALTDGASVDVVDFHLDSEGFSLDAKQATVERRGREVRIALAR